MSDSIKVLKDYKPILEEGYTFYCYYGGRGGGKTENIAIMLVIYAVKNKNARILCIRELQQSVKESIRQSIIDAINLLGVTELFLIHTNEIVCLSSGAKFVFSGMSEVFARKVKSIKRIDITWVEEASDISENTWLTLLPSVLRTPHSKIIVSFNPYSAEDIVYKYFVKNTPPEDSFVKKVCYWNNPFFKGSLLDKQREHQLKILPTNIYKHIWEGEILNVILDSLWSNDMVNKMFAEVDTYKDFMQIVISCDPATTHKDFSNEYGVVALGKKSNGHIFVLKDYSTMMSPDKFANVVNEAVEEWKEYCSDVKVVVETNQGGDFIKHAILTKNPFINVVEVRAGVDKVQRAMPVVNLCDIGMIYFDKSQDFSDLVYQMKNITFRGYLGKKGESPDRLDSFVWGVYYLASISEMDTQETYFKMFNFIHDKNFAFIDSLDNVIASVDNGVVYILVFNEVSNSASERRFLITDSLICEQKDFYSTILSLNANYILMPNNELTFSLDIRDLHINLFNTEQQNLDEALESINQLIISNRIMLKETMPIRTNGLDKGQLIKMELITHKQGQKKDKVFLWLLFYILKNML